MSTRALKAAQAAQAKADVGAYLSITLISILAARGVVKREDAVMILDSLRQALPAHDAAYAAEMRSMAERVNQVFDRLDALRHGHIESAVMSATGGP